MTVQLKECATLAGSTQSMFAIEVADGYRDSSVLVAIWNGRPGDDVTFYVGRNQHVVSIDTAHRVMTSARQCPHRRVRLLSRTRFIEPVEPQPL